MRVVYRWLAGCLVILLWGLPGCAPLPSTLLATSTITVAYPLPSATATIPPTSTSTPTAVSTKTPTPNPPPTITPTPLPSPTPTTTAIPNPLPVFSTKYLRYGAQAVPYVSSPCAYLERRWAEAASPPGTVVLPVMFHSVAQPGASAPGDPKDMSYEDFQKFLEYAHREGWETITTKQLLAFLMYNAPIPRYSMLMIIDDRRPGVVEEYFMPLLEKYDWTLTLAYIANPDSMQWAMKRIQALNQSGRLDIQSHGLTGELYILPETPDDEIEHEIQDSTSVLEQQFGQAPMAFIWPGGNFSLRAVQIARSGGYRLGFTAFSRGPLMYNWIPQGIQEQDIHDPLMLLPRAWSRAMPTNLYEAKLVSQEAQENALAVYAQEAAYFQTYCGGTLPLPAK